MLKLLARRRLASAAGRLTLTALAWSILAVRIFAAGATATKTAADPAAEAGSGGGWPILDWLIVTALVGGAVFIICRSSRRN